MKRFAATLFLLTAVAIPTSHAVVFVGSLETPTELNGTGIWADDFKISWEIEQQVDSSWEYTYHITSTDGGPLHRGEVSHIIFEISPNATSSDFWGFDGGTEINTYSSANPSNPNMPGSLYGIKLDFTDTDYHFFSTKAPVWGDFYSKNGNAGGKGQNAIWNADFLDPDPTNAPQSGLLSDGQGGYIYKILRPDSTTNIPDTNNSVPEPSSLFLLGTGLFFPFLRRKKLI